MPLKITSSKPDKIHQFIFGGALVGLALFVTKRMMSEGASNFQTIAAILVAIAAVLILDKYYWVLCPIFSVCGITIPGLPFGSTELGMLSLIAIRFIRSSIRKDPSVRMDRHALTAIPVFVWIVIAWILNPTGLSIVGSSSIGGRFYFQIVLGFLTLLTCASMKFNEKECKIIFISIFVSSCAAIVIRYLTPSLFAEAEDSGPAERGSKYELLVFTSLYLAFWARYSMMQILRSLPLLFGTALSAGALLLSGKRQMFACLGLYPLYRALLTKKEIFQTVIVFVIGLFIAIFAVAADGVVFEMPESAKRGLAIIFPKYRKTDNNSGAKDLFRVNMRIEAKRVIRNDPFFGRKGFALDLGSIVWASSGVDRDRYGYHAYAGNWHSLWYGFAADFGIPAVILWAFFFIWALYDSVKMGRRVGLNTYASACYLYYVIHLLQIATFSYTSGHSSKTTFDVWLTYGFLLAIKNGLRDSNQDVSLKSPSIASSRMPPLEFSPPPRPVMNPRLR